jgi:hypothetical protein
MGRNKENPEIESRVATIYNMATLMDDPKKILKAMGLIDSTVYKKQPDKCTICKNKKFAEVSILGVYPKPLLWECLDCRALFLRYSQEWVIRQFKQIRDVWTNLADWEVPDREDFN